MDLTQLPPRFDGIHCDQLTCERTATHRVRPVDIPIRGMLYCDEHTEMIIADGRRKGREWLAEPWQPANGGAANG